MRKLILIVIALVMTAAGCVTQKPAVNVEQNRVHFVAPKLTLELDSRYQYKGSSNENEYSFFDDGGISGTGETIERHSFFRAGEDNEECWVHVKFHKLTKSGSYYLPINYSDKKGILQSGKTDLNGVEFSYAVYAMEDESGECYLRKVMTKRVGADNNKMLKIMYTEDAKYRDDFPFRYNDWQNPANLTTAQRSRLEKFVENSVREIKASSL